MKIKTEQSINNELRSNNPIEILLYKIKDYNVTNIFVLLTKNNKEQLDEYIENSINLQPNRIRILNTAASFVAEHIQFFKNNQILVNYLTSKANVNMVAYSYASGGHKELLEDFNSRTNALIHSQTVQPLQTHAMQIPQQIGPSNINQRINNISNSLVQNPRALDLEKIIRNFEKNNQDLKKKVNSLENDNQESKREIESLKKSNSNNNTYKRPRTESPGIG